MRTIKPVVRREIGHNELRGLLRPRKGGQGRVVLRHLVIRGFDFSGLALPQSELYNTILEQCRFRRSLLSGCMMGELQAGEADFKEALLEGVDVVWTALPAARFDQARLARACFFNTNLSSGLFRGTDLTGATFSQCDLSLADFSGAILNATLFEDCLHAGVRGLNDRQLSYEPALFSERY